MRSLTTLAALLGAVIIAFPQARLPSTPQIQGRLLSSIGKPVPYLELELVDINSNRVSSDINLNAITDAKGVFTFSNVPTGRYTLSINFDDIPTLVSPYRALFYPGSPNRDSAEVFEVSDTTRLRNLAFNLRPGLIIRQVKGHPKVPDQFRSSYLQVALYEVGQASPTDHGKPDKYGVHLARGFEGTRYRFSAMVFEGDPFGPLVAAGASQPFELTKDLSVIEWALEVTPAGRRILERYTWFEPMQGRELDRFHGKSVGLGFKFDGSDRLCCFGQSNNFFEVGR